MTPGTTLVGPARPGVPTSPVACGGSARAVSVEEPGLVGEHDRLGPVAQVELLQQTRHVRLDRRVADEQLPAYLRVREPLGDQAEHLQLARGQEGHGLRRRLTVDPGELPDHAPGDGW